MRLLAISALSGRARYWVRWNLEIKMLQVQIQARYWMPWNLKQNFWDMEIQTDLENKITK